MADRVPPEELLAGFAELDLDRARRRGYPEAVYCRGKTPGQVGAIAAALRRAGARTLFTRATAAHAAAVLAELRAALLTMLNSCAPGVAVVNIDNGYGAGHLAAQIAAPC